MSVKIEQISKQFYFTVLKFKSAEIFLLYILRTAINYYIYDLGDQSYCIPFYTMWPFNWRTPIGFAIVLNLEFVTDMCAQTWFIATQVFFVGLCWLSVAFAKDITRDLSLLNIGGSSKRHEAKFIQGFCGTVQLHADARQLRPLFYVVRNERISISIPFPALLMNSIEYLDCYRLASYFGFFHRYMFRYYSFKFN